jgi:hypothetical protein
MSEDMRIVPFDRARPERRGHALHTHATPPTARMQSTGVAGSAFLFPDVLELGRAVKADLRVFSPEVISD